LDVYGEVKLDVLSGSALGGALVLLTVCKSGYVSFRPDCESVVNTLSAERFPVQYHER
jgi:hypothetical protein